MKKKLAILVLCVAICISAAIGSSTISAFAYDTTISDWGEEYFSKLDYGIYWYDGKSRVPTSDYTVKKDAPTLIFTHGWKPNGESRVREDLSLKYGSEEALAKYGFGKYAYDAYFYNYYLNKGYNVGVFYWNQFVDDGASIIVDRKIWSADTNVGMEYTTYADENAKGVLTEVDDPTNPKVSVAVLYGDCIIDALGSDFSGDLQLAGHSMGGQLTCAVSEYLCLKKDKGEIGENILPDRVTLFDPYLSATKVVGTITHTGEVLTNDTGKYCAELVAEATKTIINHNIPIEAYGVNLDMCFRNYGMMYVGIKDDDAKIEEITKTLGENIAWVYMNGMATSKFAGFSPTHVMSVDYYFTTNNFQPTKTADGIYVPCANLSTDKLRELVGMTFIQDCPKTKNSLYQSESTYYRGNFIDFTAIETGNHRLTGSIVTTGDKKLDAILYNAENEKVAECEIDGLKRYNFEGVKTGEYTVKIVRNGLEVATIENVTVGDGGLSVVEPQEVVVGDDNVLFIALIALLAVIGVVCIVSLVVKIVSYAKSRK